MIKSILDQYYSYHYRNTKNHTSELTGLKITNEDYDFESVIISVFGKKEALEIVNKSNNE